MKFSAVILATIVGVASAGKPQLSVRFVICLTIGLNKVGLFLGF